MSSTGRIRIVCVSDTHNDDLTGKVPAGDVFLHAGDMTDDGTHEELETALRWIRKLPHQLKVVIAGNHDLALDSSHSAYNPKTLALFTSSEVRDDGVVYLDPKRPDFIHNDLVSIYANPAQPDFLKSNYAFTYLPYPSPEATAAWTSAPNVSRGPLEVWLSHGAPKGRLDKIDIPGLMGCEAQWRKVAAAMPLVCVFGHYHVSYGVERIVWPDLGVAKPDDEVVKSEILTDMNCDGYYDLTNLRPGKESAFINAAWMTGKKRNTQERNRPIVIDLMDGLLST